VIAVIDTYPDLPDPHAMDAIPIRKMMRDPTLSGSGSTTLLRQVSEINKGKIKYKKLISFLFTAQNDSIHYLHFKTPFQW
jgi:hypothetical protein